MNKLHAEARRSAQAGLRVHVGAGMDGVIPGLYGLRLGRWAEWHPDLEIRLARVDALFGQAS